MTEPSLAICDWEAEPPNRASEFMGRDSRVPLRGVEVLVAEQFLDLTEVRAGAQKLRREDVPKRVRGDVLALGDACGARVAEKRLRQDGLREPPPLHADKERLLGIARADAEVVDEERLESGVDRHDPLLSALRAPDLEQAAIEVDVLPVEPEQLASP